MYILTYRIESNSHMTISIYVYLHFIALDQSKAWFQKHLHMIRLLYLSNIGPLLKHTIRTLKSLCDRTSTKQVKNNHNPTTKSNYRTAIVWKTTAFIEYSDRFLKKIELTVLRPPIACTNITIYIQVLFKFFLVQPCRLLEVWLGIFSVLEKNTTMYDFHDSTDTLEF